MGLCGLAGVAGAQSLTIGPNGVSISTGNTPNDLNLRLDQSGLRVGVNQSAAKPVTSWQNVNCAGRAMNINGSNGRVNLLGRCPSVTVNGSGNTLQIEQVGKITVRGSRNNVTWRKALTGSRPTILTSGTGNRVTTTGYVATRPAPVTAVPARPAPVRTVTPVKPVTTTPKTTTPKAPQTAQPLW